MSRVIKARERGVSFQPHGSLLIAVSGDEEEEGNDAPAAQEIAAGLIADAEHQARQTIEQAEAEADRIREEARQAGWETGHAAGEAEWRARLAQLEAQNADMLQQQEDFYTAAEPELARLSVEIARKILRQELAQNPDAVMKVIRAALHRVKDRETRVLVNPADLERVRQGRESLLAVSDGISQMEIVSDRRVGQGGCVLDTPSGYVDARIETQLTNIGEVIDRESNA